MATATKTEIEIEVVTTEEAVCLTLSMKEVRALYSLTMRCGGNPKNSPRGVIDDIRDAIKKAVGREDSYKSNWANPEYDCFTDGPSVQASDYPKGNDE